MFAKYRHSHFTFGFSRAQAVPLKVICLVCFPMEVIVIFHSLPFWWGGAHSKTRAQSLLSTLVFGGWAAGFLNAPNSVLFGVCCQPERGRKQKRERVNRRMNQCVSARERGQREREKDRARGQNDKNKPALVRFQARHLMAKNIKPWWKLTSMDVSAAVLITESLRLKYPCDYWNIF